MQLDDQYSSVSSDPAKKFNQIPISITESNQWVGPSKLNINKKIIRTLGKTLDSKIKSFASAHQSSLLSRNREQSSVTGGGREHVPVRGWKERSRRGSSESGGTWSWIRRERLGSGGDPTGAASKQPPSLPSS